MCIFHDVMCFGCCFYLCVCQTVFAVSVYWLVFIITVVEFFRDAEIKALTDICRKVYPGNRKVCMDEEEEEEEEKY